MANITSKFVSSFSELYFRTTPLTTAEIADPSSWFDDAAIVEIKGLAEIGTLANESTVIEAPEFGEKYKGKLRGQLDAGTLDASVYWSPRSAAHLAMREAASNGTRLSFGIKLKNDAAGTDLEIRLWAMPRLKVSIW